MLLLTVTITTATSRTPPNRGHLGRLAARRRAHTLGAVLHRSAAAVAVQAAWRGIQGRRVTTTARAFKAAATELQRVYRGHIARQAAARVRLWRGAKPGAPRLQLGLRLIRDTKVSCVHSYSSDKYKVSSRACVVIVVELRESVA
eukprot:2237-Heterococcus_DN1.PRE.2